MLPLALPFPPFDPVIFQIDLGPVSLALRWYAVSYIVGLIVAWRLVVASMRRPGLWPANSAPMAPDAAEDLLTLCILGVVLGGRLGFVVFYEPGYYLANPAEVLKVWQGGMSFHGGFAGVIVAGLWFCWRRGLPALQVGDVMAMGTPIGLGFGRLANFINAELWGRPTTVPWGVTFPGPGGMCPDDWFLICARHPSQLYEAALEGFVLAAILIWGAFRGGWLKRPGLCIGVFAAGYGAARIIVEFYRVADARYITPDNPLGHVVRFGQDIDAMGLSMGQLLSLPMVAIGGLIMLAALRRRPT